MINFLLVLQLYDALRCFTCLCGSIVASYVSYSSRGAEHETQLRMYIRTGNGKDLWILSHVRVSHHSFPDAHM